MILNWIKIAFRIFLADKFNFFLNLFGLSVGMLGVIISILHWADEKSYEQWNPNKNNVFIVEEYSNMGGGLNMPSALGTLSKENIPEVEDFTFTESWQFETVLTANETTHYVDRLMAGGENFFDFFPYEFVYGSPKNALENNGMTLSERTSHLLFGDENPIGKTVQMHGNTFVVNGVYKAPEKDLMNPNIIIFSGFLRDNPNDWNQWNFYLFFKLNNSKNADKVSEQIRQLFWKYNLNPLIEKGEITLEQIRKHWGDPKFTLTAISKVHLHTETGVGLYNSGGNYILLLIMFGLSLMILFSSSINFINTSMAYALKRAKEVSVRKVLGATRRTIILQFLLETALICLMSFGIALVLVELLLPYVNDFLEKDLKFDNFQLLVYLVITVFFIILFSGIIPALFLSKFDPATVLKGSFTRSRRGVWLRNGILFLQFMISSLFFITSMIVYDQVMYMSNKDLGFNGDQVVILKFKQYAENVYPDQKYERAKTLLGKLPGVKEVTTSMMTPNGDNYYGIGLKNGDEYVQSEVVGIDYNYLDVMKIKLLEGRELSPKYASDTINNCLVNETFLEKMNLKNPIGKKINTEMGDSISYNIVGVIKDFHMQGFESKIEPMMIIHYNTLDWMKGNFSNIQLKIDTQNTQKLMNEIEKIWNESIEPGFPFEYEFVNKQFAKSYETFKKQQKIFFVLSFIVILVALLGLYAVTSFVIKQRLKEVAIRKVLGAESNQIVYQLSKEFYWIVGLGIISAMPIIYFISQQWLERFAYRIDTPILPYLIGFFTLALLTIIVVSIRAYKATQVNMTEYLKYE